MAKKKNSRKALAVALGIMGIAGLSVASASSLVVDTTNEVAMGVSGDFTPCDDDGVAVDYDYNGSWEITSVTVTGIADACLGEPLSVSIAVSGGPIVGSATTMASWTASPDTDDNSYEISTVSPTTILVSAELGAATVVIG